MASYSLFIKPSALKELEALPRKDRLRVVEKIRALATNARPTGCEKLSGQEKYRIRWRMYRIIYSVQDYELTVWVVKVGHRRDVYRDK